MASFHASAAPLLERRWPVTTVYVVGTSAPNHSSSKQA